MKKQRATPSIRIIEARFGGILGEQDNYLYLPTDCLKKTGIPTVATVTLKIGYLYRNIQIGRVSSTGDSQEPVFFLSPNLALQCQLPKNTILTIKYDEPANILCLGPLIGLLATKIAKPDSYFGFLEPSLLALTSCAPCLPGLIFVFCPENLDWDRLSVTGYMPVRNDFFPSLQDESGVQDCSQTWFAFSLPIPDVVYDRIPSRSVEARPEVSEAKTRLLALTDLIYFNPMFLDKWETHLALQEIAEVNKYLPPTQLVETTADLKDFLDLYSSVFLKPSSGSLGRRIIKVVAGRNGHYRYMYRSKDKQTVQGVVTSFRELTGVVQRVMGKRTYIAQKDLHLAKFEECPFDIRVLMQKNRWGNWRRTKIYVRKAAPDSFLSNLSDGARPQSITVVLKTVFNCDFLTHVGLGEDIRRAVKEIPPALEKATGRIWGELGIDLGIDRNGKIWLIEANSKPFRALVSASGSFDLIKRSLMRPLEFAKYLSGFYRHSPVK